MENEEFLKARENLTNKVNIKEDTFLEDDNEYYFAIGQCASFMLDKYIGVNKLFKKNLLGKDLLRSKDNKKLKDNFRILYNKCDNVLFIEDKRFNKINKCLSMVFGYIPNKDLNMELVELGFIGDNILY